MAQTRYCQRCGKDVKCREVASERSVALYCPQCDKKLATLYGHVVIQ